MQSDNLAEPDTLTPLRARVLLWGICLITFVVYLDTSITPVAIPTIIRLLRGGDTSAQWILDGYTLAFASLLLSGGLIGDRFGVRRILLAGTLAFVGASVVCATAPSMTILVAGRVLQGVCAAAIVPLSIASLSSHFPDPRARARAVGLWGSTAGVALALGPLVGGTLVTSVGWRSLFWINVPIGVGALVALAFALRRNTSASISSIDIPGQLLFVLTGTCFTLALIEGPQGGWGRPFVVTMFLTAGLSLTAFVLWERRTQSPMLSPSVLRLPAVLAACAVNFFGLFGLYGALFVLTLYFQQSLGLSPIASGLRFLPLFGLMGVGSLAASAISRKLGTRSTMLCGLAAIVLGLAGLTSIELGAPFAVYGVALGLLGIGIPLSGGVVAVQAMIASVPSGAVGAASGAMNTFRQFGAVFGVAIAAIASPRIGNEVTSMSTTFVISAAGALVGGVLTFVVLRPMPIRATASLIESNQR